MLIIIEMTLGEEILGKHKNTEFIIIEVDVEVTTEMTILEEVEVGLGKDNIQVILEREDQSSSRWRSSLQASTNKDRITCFKYRECDHFTNDCPNSNPERE